MAEKHRLGRDFQLFFAGQLTSQLGSSVTMLLLPVVVFRLTGSALNLGITAASEWMPYLLCGLLIGAYVDRLPRRRLMIATDVVRGVVIASVPALSLVGHLRVEWIYLVGFVSSTLTIVFDTAEVAAIPAIVRSGDLVEANGRVQAAYSAAQIVGPLLGGSLLAVLAAAGVLWVDAGSFAVSAVTLLLIRTSFDPREKRRPSRVRDDIVEGLRFVLRHPVLRSISAMMAMINIVTNASTALLVLFAAHKLGVTDVGLGVLFASASAGVVVFGVLAGRIRRLFTFSQAILGSLVADGLLLAAFGLCRWFPLSVMLWGLGNGLGIFFNINTRSLRQLITPPELLGRVMSIASVLAWSAIPLGTLAGGALVSAGLDVGVLYVASGILVAAIAGMFALGPLGRAQRYVPELTGGRASAAVAAPDAPVR